MKDSLFAKVAMCDEGTICGEGFWSGASAFQISGGKISVGQDLVNQADMHRVARVARARYGQVFSRESKSYSQTSKSLERLDGGAIVQRSIWIA